MTSIPAVLAATVERHGDRTAIVDGDVSLTWAALDDAATTFGAALVNAGIAPGDRVAIWHHNAVEWVVAVLGLWQAGAVLVPVNTRFKGNEAAEILRRSRANVLLTADDFLDTDYVALLEASGVELPDLATTIVSRDWHDFLAGANDGARAEVARRRAAVSVDDPSDILFTSGTTGVPKGVLQTHGRTLGVASDWVRMTGLDASDRYLMVNPYFHMFGLKAGILVCVISGAQMLPQPVFDVERVLERVAGEAVTVLPGAPTIYQSILDHPSRDRYDLSTLRIAVTGAADIPVELIRRIRSELPFEQVLVGYGLTESGTVSGTSPDDDPEIVASTVGRPRPGFEVRIVEGGADVEPGQPGEIIVRGPTVMAGYLDDPEATAAALDPDGWLHTGDLGLFDEGGCLHIVGRLKDMFIVGGFNAYPAEIENILLRHPAVQQVAVIGIPDERLGEVGMAFVVPAPSSPSDADTGAAILAWARDQMANYKVPRAIELLDELPLNATGKVMKDELRARVANR